MTIYKSFIVTLTRLDGNSIVYIVNGDSRDNVEHCEAARYRHAFTNVEVVESD